MKVRMKWRADKLISNLIRMSTLQTPPPAMKNHTIFSVKRKFSTSVRINAEFITSAFDKITKEKQASHVSSKSVHLVSVLSESSAHSPINSAISLSILIIPHHSTSSPGSNSGLWKLPELVSANLQI